MPTTRSATPLKAVEQTTISRLSRYRLTNSARSASSSTTSTYTREHVLSVLRIPATSSSAALQPGIQSQPTHNWPTLCRSTTTIMVVSSSRRSQPASSPPRAPLGVSGVRKNGKKPQSTQNPVIAFPFEGTFEGGRLVDTGTSSIVIIGVTCLCHGRVALIEFQVIAVVPIWLVTWIWHYTWKYPIEVILSHRNRSQFTIIFLRMNKIPKKYMTSYNTRDITHEKRVKILNSFDFLQALGSETVGLLPISLARDLPHGNFCWINLDEHHAFFLCIMKLSIFRTTVEGEIINIDAYSWWCLH